MFLKKCASCDAPFQTAVFRQRKCTPECGRDRSKRQREQEAREKAREEHDVEFIAVDGEGSNRVVWAMDWDDDGEEITVEKVIHEYVLLSVGDKSLHKNGEALNHEDIFEFLWEQYLEHPRAAFVGFFLGYDFTLWLKSLPVHSARALLTKEGIARRKPPKGSSRVAPWPVRDGRWEYLDGRRILVSTKWEFDILGTKRFKLRPYVKYEDIPTHTVKHKDGTTEEKKIGRPWMYICDTGSFFQTSFLNAINPKDWDIPVLSDDEYKIIYDGKKHREDAQLDDQMIQYNLLENDVLARVMRRLNEGFVADGIKLNKNQWFGPGQAAQAWMKLIGVPTGKEIREKVPVWARDAARKTYYGGWFEIFNHGPVPGISYAYDINSAYPAIIAKLPCLLHGEWYQSTGNPGRLPTGAIRMVYADVRGNDPWVGAMPHRTPDGSILRPQITKGWYWWHEIKAAQRAGIISTVKVHESITYVPCKCPPPMASIAELYQGRLRVGKNSPEGKAKKLVYNSAYGKLAQSIGEPRFSNSIWASLITAGCRTMILDAIATHPTKTASLLMIATDGIVFKEPHPNLDIDPTRLGAWDNDEYHNLSLFMPGLYWDDKTREMIERNETPKLKSRGVAAKDMATVIHRVDAIWTKDNADGPIIPKIGLKVEWAMTTAKQAITRNHWTSCGRITRGGIRKLSGDPSAKRFAQWFAHEWGGLRSWAYREANEPETTYYDHTFGETIEELLEELYGDQGAMVTPDGKVSDLQAWAFRR